MGRRTARARGGPNAHPDARVHRGADRLVDVGKWTAWQQQSVLEEGAAHHGIAGIDVLGDGMFHEASRRDDRHFSTPDVCFVDDAAHTAEIS